MFVSRRLTTVAVAALLAVGVSVVPANAEVLKRDSKSCNSNQHVRIQSLSDGTTRHYAPRDTLIATYYIPLNNFAVRTTDSNYSAVAWKVTTTGALDNQYTYATCEAGGPFAAIAVPTS